MSYVGVYHTDISSGDGRVVEVWNFKTYDEAFSTIKYKCLEYAKKYEIEDVDFYPDGCQFVFGEDYHVFTIMKSSNG